MQTWFYDWMQTARGLSAWMLLTCGAVYQSGPDFNMRGYIGDEWFDED